MPGNEDYLDSLLKMAQQDIAPDSAINRVKQMAEEAEEAEEAVEEPVVEETAVDEPSLEEAPETTEEPLEIEDPGVIEEPVVVEEPIIEEPLADVEMPSEEDISDLLNSLGDITAEEPVAEDSAVIEEAVPEEETISQDDIASLLESIGDISTEEPVAEDPVAEEPAVEEPAVEETPADPNAMLSADQIAAMFESANVAEEAVVTEEPVVAEEPVAEEPAAEEQPILDEVTGEVEVPIEELPLDDVLSAEATEEPAEETVSEEIPGDVLEQPSEEASTEEEADEESSLDLDALLEGLDAEDKSEAETVEMTNTLDTVPGSDELMSDLSQEDIEKLLNDAKNVEDESEPQGEVEVDMNDLSQLESLGVFDKDADLSELGESSEELDEISSLLKTADNNDFSLNEDDDLMNLLSMESKRQAEEEEAAKKAESENASEEDSEGKDKKKKKKKEKGKKKKGAIPEDLEGEIDIDALNEAIPEKKQSAFSKFISFMTASDEDAPASAEGENGEFGFEGVQGENKEILDEIDKEGDKKGKKKPKKDKKAKKGAAKEGDEGGDEGDEEGGGKKKKKPKKEKVKKEKTPKEEEPDNSKPLNKKNVRKIFVMAATLLLLLMLFIKLVPAMINKEQARKAYYKGDYEATYTALFGEKLSEGDQLLFDRSEIILKMGHKYDAFLSYNRMGMRTEALDQLLQAVARYEEWLYIAEVCGCKDAFNAEYEKIVTALSVTYDLTLDRAKEINAMPTDLEYSLMVESIANHTEYIDPNAPLPEPFVPEPDPLEMNFEDVLPEEQL